MGKLKAAKCVGCGKSINRHDGNRIELRVQVDKPEIQRPIITYHFGCRKQKGE